jgi:hypothetical protein
MGQTTAAASGPHHTFPQIAPQYYIAQILDMFAAGDIVLVQLICMMEITRKTLPTLSWEQLRIASRASIHQRVLLQTPHHFPSDCSMPPVGLGARALMRSTSYLGEPPGEQGEKMLKGRGT